MPCTPLNIVTVDASRPTARTWEALVLFLFVLSYSCIYHPSKRTHDHIVCIFLFLCHGLFSKWPLLACRNIILTPERVPCGVRYDAVRCDQVSGLLSCWVVPASPPLFLSLPHTARVPSLPRHLLLSFVFVCCGNRSA